MNRYHQRAERSGADLFDAWPEMKNRGVTLTELMIVISIIGILVIALGFSFQGWMGRYKIESQTKELYVDVMNARARAMQRNRTHLLDFPSATSYRISEDLNNNGAFDAGEALPTYPRTVEHALTRVGGTATFTFNTRGMASPGDTIQTTLPADVIPDYDCIVISQTRIATGKWNGTTNVCDVK